MARQSHLVPMRHPDANRTYNAPPSSVRFWEKQGWKILGDHPAPTPPSEPEPARAAAAKKKEA